MTTFTLKRPNHHIKKADMHNYVGHVVSIACYPDRKFLVVKDGVFIKVVTLGSGEIGDFVVRNVAAEVYENHGKLEVTE